MLRAIKTIILVLLLIGIVILSVANRGQVTLHLLPDGMKDILTGFVPVSIELPMFIVVIMSILVGLLLGYIIEYLREHKHRRRANINQREAARLEEEVQALKRKTMSEEDEVLALLN